MPNSFIQWELAETGQKSPQFKGTFASLCGDTVELFCRFPLQDYPVLRREKLGSEANMVVLNIAFVGLFHW
jgi:hypothetical protein